MLDDRYARHAEDLGQSRRRDGQGAGPGPTPAAGCGKAEELADPPPGMLARYRADRVGAWSLVTSAITPNAGWSK